MINRRSDIRLASAERLAESGMTKEEQHAAIRALSRKFSEKNILLMAIDDPTWTVSQTDRASKLMRELHATITK